ncbi:MAG: TetR/AcrR family transcriptional regulator [Clostridiaceae bacterium]|nr:TetR/AcrR family transcriptional regulator [Clostridiaceae bacterium]
MNKQPEITDATRETLINAFFQLAQKNNITQITVREIINLARYSRATFYRYFKDVFALVEYAEDSFFQKAKAALAEYDTGNCVYDRHFFDMVDACWGLISLAGIIFLHQHPLKLHPQGALKKLLMSL